MAELLTTEIVAAELHVAVSTLYYWRWRGEGPPAFKLGRRVVYDRAELETWVQDQRNTAVASGTPA